MVSRPQFAQQDHVGIFPQRRTQGRGEALGIALHFALVHQAVLLRMHEFDRVFDGQDVLLAVLVQVVDHRRQCGGLAAAGGPGHQHQPAGRLGNLPKHFPQSQLLQALYPRGNQAQHRTDAPGVPEGIDPKPRHTRQFMGEIQVIAGGECLALSFAHQFMDQRLHLWPFQGRARQRANIAIDAQHRRQPGGQMQVRSAPGSAQAQEFGDVHSAPQFQ